MHMTMTGGCQSGAVRYEITAEPRWLYVCHCKDCQRQSSSAFGMSLAVARDALAVTGALRSWTKTAESGRTTDCFFCPVCGTRIYHAPSRDPSIVNVKAGTLDETRALLPLAHLWTNSRQRGFDLPDGRPHFAREPDELSKAMAALTGEP
jgi:hypothetical protein